MNSEIIRNIKKAAKWAETAATVVSAVSKPKLTAISTVGRAVVDLFEFEEKQRDGRGFYYSDWMEYSVGAIGLYVIEELIRKHNLNPIHTGDRGHTYYVIKVGDVPLGWTVASSYIEGPYSPVGHDSSIKVRQATGRLIWESFGNRLIIENSSSRWEESINIRPDPIKDFFETDTGPKLADYFRQYLAHGHSRSVLIYGAPGTGKSNIARHTAEELGGLSARLKATNMPAETSGPILETLSPSVVIIDDLDRALEPKRLLDQWETLRASVPALIVTANDLSQFDPAMLRAGRFDKIIKVDKLSDRIVEKMLLEVPPAIRDRAKEFPIAYIKELALRTEVEGEEEALRSIEELDFTRRIISGEKRP